MTDDVLDPAALRSTAGDGVGTDAVDRYANDEPTETAWSDPPTFVADMLDPSETGSTADDAATADTTFTPAEEMAFPDAPEPSTDTILA